MRALAILALVAVLAAFAFGCASTMSASGGGGGSGSSRSALLEEMRGHDTVVIDKFGRTLGSNDWIDEPWMFRFKRLPR